ncbi:methyltransferase type 11 [Fusarium langsethiae]|uniref:Methyltransferase type 11 n=1 Tax=Fusarium langsethiae TaxID=179993 RepID=A0A0N0DBB6_FUSLA|nr:methyltransferase type 11 [Fusarium langsethiae]GKU11433.1 unnamed protein product [Fusarium langsethiae]GKU12770.1 unnamed protein product [Fusarium langsethiae]
MPSPSKRPRSDQFDDHFTIDPETTPRRPQWSVTRAHTPDDVFQSPTPSFPAPSHSSSSTIHSMAPTSVFTDALASRPHFPPLGIDQQAPSVARQPRSISPSKQYRKRGDLLRLDRPVKFKKEMDMRAALPADAQGLYDALVMAEHCEGILPAALKDVPGVNLKDVRPYMWQPVAKAANANDAGIIIQSSDRSVVEKHSRLLEIIRRSNKSSDRHRSEAAWNSHVHCQILHELAESSSVIVEDITSARIVPAFRPSISDELPNDFSSQTSFSTTGTASSYNSNTSPSRTNSRSVHKMVDFALVLEPDEDLEAVIEPFTKSSPTATVNQTAYLPLKSCPAPVFIETKTSAGNIETANVQLGVWIAAWHESIRSLMKRGGSVERIITVPLIQVVDGAWTLMFAIDAGNEIHILDRDFRIGNSSTIQGMYQLQAALSAITNWIEGKFKAWITQVLCKALA